MGNIKLSALLSHKDSVICIISLT